MEHTSRQALVPDTLHCLASDQFSIPVEIRNKVYRPLAPWQTRILKIHPGADLALPITCDLLIADMIAFPGIGLVDEREIVEYEALSYSWGYPTFTHTMTCNKAEVPVTENLYDALRYLRSTVEDRYMWCDACCIDQANLAEKARQVEIMFTVFEKASKVVAWLGLASPKDEFLLRYIATTHDHEPHESDPNFVQARNAAIDLVSSRSFFERCWIRQEYGAAQDLEIACGHHRLSFPGFKRGINALLSEELSQWKCKKIQNKAPSASRAFLRFKYFVDDCSKGSRGNCFSIMIKGAVYKATLPQDKIFSMLGIAAQMPTLPSARDANAATSFPRPDYTRSTSLVYQDFVKHTINSMKSLDFLAIVSDRSLIGDDLPSWAIDLRVDTSRYIIPTETYEELPPALQDFHDHGVLIAYGRTVGSFHFEANGTHLQTDALRHTGSRLDLRLPGTAHRGHTTEPQHQKLFDCLTQQSVSLLCGYSIADMSWEPPETRPRFTDEVNSLLDACKYTWREWYIHEPNVEITRGMEQSRFCAFVTDLAMDTDLLVRLEGSSHVFVLRETSDGRYAFLGPAIYYAGTYLDDWKITQNNRVLEGAARFQAIKRRLEPSFSSLPSEKFLLV